jgi:hypothetical protein
MCPPMDIRGYTTSGYAKTLPPLPASRQGGPSLPAGVAVSRADDLISLSRDLVVRDAVAKAGAGQTRLIAETVDPIEKGFRKTQTFERQDGRTFTRIEDITVTDRGARRSVLQQNVSGSTTRLEDVLERQDDGTFKRTQIFTDEAGETDVHIETGYVSQNPFILSGGRTPPAPETPTPPTGSLRGTQLDLSI